MQVIRLDNPPGDVHLKYGYIQGDAYYVIKIASGFYENQKLGLPSSNGLMLLFCQKTGELLSILLDEGYLTDLRTATAGAIAAKYLAPRKVNCIGIVGTGTQARLQLRNLKRITDCRNVIVWGPHKQELDPAILHKADLVVADSIPCGAGRNCACHTQPASRDRGGGGTRTGHFR